MGPPTDWELLGVEPGADPATIRRAWRSRRLLYDTDELGTYGLLLPDERRDHLRQLDRAYERLLGHPPPSVSSIGQTPAPAHRPQAPDGPAPDPVEQPGAHLRHVRTTRGLALEQVAAETRIRPAVIADIENERTDTLPAPVYVRGFVVQIARTIGVADPEQLATAFVGRMQP